MIYFVTESGTLYAVTADSNGEIDWRKTYPVEDAKFYGSPELAGDLILVSVVNAEPIVIAINLSGADVWSFIPD